MSCSIFFPMAAKALQTLSLLPVTVTSLSEEVLFEMLIRAPLYIGEIMKQSLTYIHSCGNICI